MSFEPPPQPASPLTITAAEVVAMLMLHHRGELETTVPQMERGSAGIPVMTFSCRLNVSFKTRLFYFWTQKPKTEYIFSVENETLIRLQHNNNGFCFFCLLFSCTILNRQTTILKKTDFKHYFGVNIDNSINLMPITLFHLSSCICLQAKFPSDISMTIFFFFL